MDIVHSVLACYGFNKNDYTIKNFGNGLINSTCLVQKNTGKYILQRVNNYVFEEPWLIADNLEKIRSYLEKERKDYFFTSPIKTLKGETMVQVNGSYYRLFSFVQGSRTINVVQTPEQAYEAAKQFGKFTRVLSDIDVSTINITLRSFHDLSLRNDQFLKAIDNGNSHRIRKAKSLIDELQSYTDIVERYHFIKGSPQFKLRVTHHDTKISNVLFDKNDKGICVIDLDTVMPGYFISDVGDMMRTYLCPVSEEEKDFSKIEIRDEFYYAIIKGYNTYMQDELSETEKEHFFYSGKFMIYMQALRFLTDYLNNDVYYGAKYQGHNFVRAQNQATLLKRLMEKEKALSSISVSHVGRKN